ncbi:MAG: SMC-Scp complex subunit ScpB [Candidatus Sungiibacteriota bacterium]|uniref:SMC-Scp complex subunit ScpB n=1 Tax=Candidatus Sungiibacteriota bacterium TaxID=2750080 RepID=A0A7T5UQL7_9BACT|nr:MAG: SMC-Scp complex subunit ScpB [Candidatus Sungbacteria bacterium]
MTNLKSIIETLLFIYGEPLALEKLIKIAKNKKEAVLEALSGLKKDYEGRGLTLLEKDNTYQLGSNPANAKYVEDLVKSEFTEELSRAALETVSIVAYKGPLTRAQIEYVRGVNSSFTLRNLLMRGLVERIENPKDARSFLYRVSFDFLKHLGLTKIGDLPQYEEFRKEKIEVLEEAPTKQENEAGP